MFFIPSTKELLVNSANMVPGNNRIDIYSMDGKLLKYLQFGGREVQLNLIDLAPGIYIARMSDGQHTESLKIIIP
jgi:hypothetical protein